RSAYTSAAYIAGRLRFAASSAIWGRWLPNTGEFNTMRDLGPALAIAEKALSKSFGSSTGRLKLELQRVSRGLGLLHLQLVSSICRNPEDSDGRALRRDLLE